MSEHSSISAQAPTQKNSGYPGYIRPKWRPFVGMFFLLIGLFIYVFLASMIGDKIGENTAIRTLYYGFAGLLWLWPARFLLRWIGAPHKA